jgi:hypothetical protein
MVAATPNRNGERKATNEAPGVHRSQLRNGVRHVLIQVADELRLCHKRIGDRSPIGVRDRASRMGLVSLAIGQVRFLARVARGVHGLSGGV